MYFVVMPNRNHNEHLGMFCIVMPSIFFNCPALICLPNIASYLRETPLVICEPWSYLLHTVYNTCCNHLFTVPCNSYCFPHCAINPFVLQDRRDWQPLCFELGKVLVCFCIDSTLLKAPPSTRQQHFSGAWGGVITNKLLYIIKSYWFDNLG